MARRAWDADWTSFGLQLACNLRTLRQLRGLTQEKLAESSGVSRNQISNLERNENTSGKAADPSLSTLYRLARALEVPPVALLPCADLLVSDICNSEKGLEVDVHWPNSAVERESLVTLERVLRRRSMGGARRAHPGVTADSR